VILRNNFDTCHEKTMQSIDQLLSKALQENHLKLDSLAKEKLIHYLQLLKTWNRVFNLTTITKPDEMVYLHLIDSLMVFPYLKGTHLLDVGSGAGLPGLPLAVLNPKQQWVLLDKNNKKTRFLTQVVAELGLDNVKIIHGRSEDFHPAQCFDSILSRALGTISTFINVTEHLACPDGVFIAMKGKYGRDELDRLPKGFTIQKVADVDIKGMDIERHIICLVKNKC
jgi:16S rRNA (guanine527-N7)-methyltransferase